MFTDFDNETEYKLRFRANGTVEVESTSDYDHQLYELDLYTNDLWED